VSWRRLKHLASIAVSNVDKKTVSGERSVRLCNYTDVYYNERITAELQFMEATASADQIASFGLRADDVLLTKDSETPDDIAVPAYVVADLSDVICGYHLALLRPSQEVDGRYLFWALSSRSSREQFSASANGITRFGLRYDSFGEVLVPLPPIATQRAIADYLDRETARIDALIDKKRRLKELLQERRQTLITEAISRSHDPGTAARGDRVSWRRLKHYCDGPPEYGLSVSSDAYVDDGVRLLRTTDIDDDGALSPDSEGVFVGRHLIGPRHVLRPGDLLFSRAGSLGRCFRVPQEARDLTFAGYLVRFRPLPSFEPRYIEYCAAAAFAQASIRADAVTSTISNFNAERYGNLLLPDSDPEQQRAIADYLDQETARIDALVERIDRQVALLQEHRQALITAAVSGELEIPGVAA